MNVTPKRPINLDLATLKFPAMAIASILHRISGLVLFLLLPVMIYFLSQSIHSIDTFNRLHEQLNNPFYKLIIWAFAASWIYHLLAGFRHIIMDFGWGEHLPEARYSAITVIILAVIFTLLLGIWIW